MAAIARAVAETQPEDHFCYASHLNPVERIWGVAKSRVVANHCYPSLAALRRAVQEYLANITPEAALQTAGLNV